MSLKDDMAGVVPPDKLGLFEFCGIVGDAAIITLPASLDRYKAGAADAILSKRKNVRIVLNKLSKADRDERVPQYEVLKGDNTIVTYREYGFTYRFDITKVFFNRHLSYERHRIASNAVPGESVLIPFAGAGPFVLPVAARGCRVVAVEKSAEACKWLASNARLNRLEASIDILNADALTLPSQMNKTFDRVILPTPYGMDEALEILSPLARHGGVIHFYTFKKKHQIAGLISHFEGIGLKVEHYRRCGNVAPGVSRWAFDLKK